MTCPHPAGGIGQTRGVSTPTVDPGQPEPATVAVTGSASRWVPADFADVSV